MPVKVKFLAVLRGLASKEEDEIELERPVTLDELVRKISERQGEAFRKRFLDLEEGWLRPDIMVFINGADYRLVGGRKAEIRDGFEVVFLPTVHGG